MYMHMRRVGRILNLIVYFFLEIPIFEQYLKIYLPVHIWASVFYQIQFLNK